MTENAQTFMKSPRDSRKWEFRAESINNEKDKYQGLLSGPCLGAQRYCEVPTKSPASKIRTSNKPVPKSRKTSGCLCLIHNIVSVGGCGDSGSSECFSEWTPDLGGHLLHGNEAFKVSFSRKDL